MNTSLVFPKSRWTFLLVVLAVLPLSGCYLAMKNSFLKDDFDASTMQLPFKLLSVRVADTHAQSQKDIKISNLAWPGTKTTGSATLTPERQAMVQGQMLLYFNGKGRDVMAYVEILKSDLAFEAHAMSEREQVFCRVRVTLFNAKTDKAFVWGEGEVTAFVQSMDASPAYIQKLYDKALRHSLYKSIEAIKGEI